MSMRRRKTVVINGIQYINASHIFEERMLPARVIGSLCLDPQQHLMTDRKERMIRADAVSLLMRHADATTSK